MDKCPSKIKYNEKNPQEGSGYFNVFSTKSISVFS